MDAVGVPLDILAPSALLGLVVLSIIRGWLVPKPTVDLLLEANAKRTEQVDQLVEHLGTAVAFIEATTQAARQTEAE